MQAKADFRPQVRAIPDTLTRMSQRAPFHRATAGAAAAVLALVPAAPALGTPGESAQTEAAAAGAAVPATFPLQAKSLAAHLSARNRARLPRANVWAGRVLADVMDQPTGLTEVQNVSALHIRRIFRKHLGPESAAAGLRIAWRESRLLPNVVNTSNANRTNDWGLFQLNDGGTLQHAGGRPGASALRPRWNARAAARLIADVGWWPWGGMGSA
jgi:hypothetical protein